MEEPKCPECDKVIAVKDKSQAIGEFIDWLTDNFYTICEDGNKWDEPYRPTHKSIEVLLAEYFGIDLKKVEQEKQALFDYIRQKSEEAKND